MFAPLAPLARPLGRVGSLISLLVLSLALAACSAAASPAVPANPVPVNVLAPGVASSGTTMANAGSAIAYPYPIYGGNPGTAPDHSILVMGTGQAEMKADGSNAAGAERTALASALAQAKRRADDIASATGVTITGVLSVSESVSQGWITPLGVETPGGPATAPSTGSLPAPVPPMLTTPQLEVTVTVAYAIGS